MVMNCVPVEILKHASFADHVLTMVPVPLHPVNPSTLSEKLMTSWLTGVQLSNASAWPVKNVEVLCSQLIVSDGANQYRCCIINNHYRLNTSGNVATHIRCCPVACKLPVPLHWPRFSKMIGMGDGDEVSRCAIVHCYCRTQVSGVVSIHRKWFWKEDRLMSETYCLPPL
jgi:hypothetical protein